MGVAAVWQQRKSLLNDRASPESAVLGFAAMTYGLVGRLIAQPGRRDELRYHLVEAARLLGANPECLQYLVSTSPGDDDGVWVTELWTDRAAHAASLEPEEIRAVVQRARPLIAGMSDRTELDVHGGKGLPAGA